MSFPADMTVSDSIAPTLPPAISGLEKEEALAKRFNRNSLFQKDLTFEFTREPDFLHQYYKIREVAYNSVWNLTHFSGAENESDRKGHILVVRQGNFCVGGIKLNLKSPRKTDLLPIETGDFRLEKHFPELQRHQMTYGQFSGFALLQEYHGGEITIEIMRRLLGKSYALNIDVLFAACPLLNARLYKQYACTIGFKDIKVHHDIELPLDPTTEGIRLYLASGALKDTPTRKRPTLVPETMISGSLEEA